MPCLLVRVVQPSGVTGSDSQLLRRGHLNTLVPNGMAQLAGGQEQAAARCTTWLREWVSCVRCRHRNTGCPSRATDYGPHLLRDSRDLVWSERRAARECVECAAERDASSLRFCSVWFAVLGSGDGQGISDGPGALGSLDRWAGGCNGCLLDTASRPRSGRRRASVVVVVDLDCRSVGFSRQG